jgi:hypothetical protein
LRVLILISKFIDFIEFLQFFEFLTWFFNFYIYIYILTYKIIYFYIILIILHVYILKISLLIILSFSIWKNWKLHGEKLVKICVFQTQYKFIFQYFRPGSIAFYSIKYRIIWSYIFYFQCNFQFNIKLCQKIEAIVVIIKMLIP